MHDIRGLDSISWWPAAPGWWLLAFLLLAVSAGIYFYRRYKYKKARSWQAEVKSMFAALRDEPDSKKKAAALSELLRRLTIRQYGRNACAGLEGKAWLEWLAKYDPEGFDWKKNAKLLIEAPYMPSGLVPANDIEPLIKAAERWVK